MPGFGILTGGQRKEIFSTTPTGTPQGVFAANPGSTSKYSFNWAQRSRDGEYRETMSRLFIDLGDDPAVHAAFLATVTKETEPLAKALINGGDSGGAGGTGFIDFLLTEAQENFNEKLQIADTLTDNYVAYYSGRDPVTASYSGVLLNTYQDDQRVWFFRLYNEILRGTQLAARNLVVRLRYDSFLVSGYLNNLNMMLDGDTERTASRFSFQMLVKRIQVMTPSMALPTQMPEPFTPVNESGWVYDEREGITMPETPPTAVEGPAAEPLQAGATDPTREELLALGLDETAVDKIMLESTIMRTVSAIDAREEEWGRLSEGVDRIVEKFAANETNIVAPIMGYPEPTVRQEIVRTVDEETRNLRQGIEEVVAKLGEQEDNIVKPIMGDVVQNSINEKGYYVQTNVKTIVRTSGQRRRGSV